jgi:O-antigen/teichoic acid export membrane protein
MTLAGTVARNTLAGFAGQAAVKLIQLGTSAVLARTLHASGFGDLGYLLAVLSFFQFVGDLGVEKIALREIAREPERAPSVVGAAISLRVLLSTGAAALAALFFALFSPTATLVRLGALAALSLPLGVASIYPAYYQAVLRVGTAAWIAVVQGTITSGLLLLAALAPAAASARRPLVVAAVALAPIPSLAASAWIARRDLRPRIPGGRALWGPLLGEAAPLAFNTICILVGLRADQVILRSMKGADALGHYSAALRFFDAFTIVPSVLLFTVFPLMARFDRVTPERLYETARWSYKVLSVFILPVALATTVLAEPIVRTIYGAPFLPAARPLAILMWSLFFFFTSMVTFDAVTAAGRQRVFLALSVFTTAVNIALNLVLIPRYGATGAATAALLYAASNLPVLALLRATRPLVGELISASWRPLLAAGLLSIVPALGLSRAAFLALLLPGYALLLFASGALGPSDLALLRKALGR